MSEKRKPDLELALTDAELCRASAQYLRNTGRAPKEKSFALVKLFVSHDGAAHLVRIWFEPESSAPKVPR